MNSNIYFFENVIEEIENNLVGEINISSLAKKANMSVYEFRRIFTFVAKIPINEYIRKRRLSKAAVELQQGECSITEIAVKYGYDTASSFSRAFKEYHGVSPTEARDKSTAVKVLSRVGADIITTGGNDISYKILEDQEYSICGFCGESPITDTECCEQVWQDFYKSDFADNLSDSEKLYVAYTNKENSVECVIGIRDLKDTAKAVKNIKPSLWACFELRTTDDAYVNQFYKDIIIQWLRSVGYERNYGLPNIEVYPANMEADGFAWEIRIPIMVPKG